MEFVDRIFETKVYLACSRGKCLEVFFWGEELGLFTS